MQKRGLIVVTSTGRLPTGRRAGFWLPEAAYPWRALATADLGFEFLSTKDGPPPIDGIDRSDPPQRHFLRDTAVQRKLAATTTAEHYDPADFAVVFIAGGPGAMWDFPRDERLAGFLASALAAGTVVAATCHGVAALLACRSADGTAMVAGRRLTGFSNQEETAIGLASEVPFLLADALTERGARYEAGEPFHRHVVRDENLVTGQNPASAAAVAAVGVELATHKALPPNWLRRPARGHALGDQSPGDAS